MTGDYQIVTNFLPAVPELAFPCWRWATVHDRMEHGRQLTVEWFRDTAEAAHQGTAPGARAIYTRYTTIGDLRAGKLYLWYDLDYTTPVVFDLAEELAKGAHKIRMSDLFVAPTTDADAGAPGPDAGAPDSGTADASP